MKITNSYEIKAKNIDWKGMGQRFKCFRQHSNWSQSEAGKLINLSESAIQTLESGGARSSSNIIWTISNTWNVSLNWLLNGIGKFHDDDPAGLLPETLIVEKGAGIRRSALRAESEDGEYGDETLEFVMAIDKFKTRNNVPFPSLTQIYELMNALGYRKSVPARIAPLGYLLDKQRLAEELKQIQESTDPCSEDEIKNSSEDEVLVSYRRKRNYKNTLWKKGVTKPCLVCFSVMAPNKKDTQETWKRRKICSNNCRNRLTSIWSDEEVQILRENYYEKGVKVRNLLPAKTDKQIKHRVQREKIRVKDELRGHGRPQLLTDEQKAIVRDKYPEMGTAICKLPAMSGVDPKQIHSWCHRNNIKFDHELNRWNSAGEYKACIQCGNLMWPKKDDKPCTWIARTLCSKECRNKQLAVTLKGRSSVEWTDEMDNAIKIEYRETDADELSGKLGVSKSLLYQRAKKLGASRPLGTKKYLEKPGDDDLIREWYPSIGAVELKKRFFNDRPEVTAPRIRHRLEKLQIKRLNTRFNFSPEDEEIIRKNYPTMGVECDILLTHNPKATRYRIMQRAAQLGIPRNKCDEQDRSHA